VIFLVFFLIVLRRLSANNKSFMIMLIIHLFDGKRFIFGLRREGFGSGVHERVPKGVRLSRLEFP